MNTAVRHRATTIQRGMWIASQLDPIGSEFTVSTAQRLTGPLDTGALQTALDLLLDRHEILRARFLRTSGTDLEVTFEPGRRCVIEHADLSRLPGQQAERTARQRIEAAARVPFDMEQDPLVRVLLLRLDATTHILSAHLHHAVCDGWSMGLLFAEWSELYEAVRSGAQPGPGTPAESYFRHAAPASPEETEAGLAYWRRRLEGARPLALPLVGRRGSHEREGAGHRFTVAAPLLAKADAYARRAHTTRYVVLLTAFAALLGRWCRTGDVTVGSTVATRVTESAQQAVGPLFNTLALRGDVAPGQSFDACVGQATETVFDAFEHCTVPYEDVLRELRAGTGAAGRSPLFNVFFELDHEPDASLALPGTKSAPFDFGDHAPKTDIMVSLKPDGPDGTALSGTITYRTAACDAQAAASLADGFLALLEAAVDRPGRDLADLPVMSEAAHDEVTRRLPDGGTADLPAVLLHQLFEDQVRRTPDAVAVRTLGAPGTSLTYAELNARANRLARHLRERGVGPERTVGVLLRRSPELLVAFLAVWKAGGAYVPLDPAFPEPRLRFVVADADAALVVTEHGLLPTATGLGRPLAVLDDDADTLAGYPDGDLEGAAEPDALAYVIHTSGSTGTPKGVLVEHRGLVNFVLWCVRRYAAHGDGGAPLFSSVAFDMVVPNLYTPLLTGQTVAVVPEDTAPDDLAAVLSSGAPYSFVKLTPGHLEVLTAHLDAAAARGLARQLVVGADSFPASALRAWRDLAGDGTPVLNEYGPTEASVANCVYDTAQYPGPGGASGTGDAGATLPIGRPIPRTTMYVLDADARPVPRGLVGELWIGGDCVARGYAGRPGTTAERFRDDPYGPPGSRLYRTGDLGRWLPGGDLEFLGRTDHQVKIRGYRIEPGEVEAALTALPGVRQALVVAGPTPAGHTALLGYAVAEPGTTVDPAALREELARTLPAHLVPARVIGIESVPLNENGKVDRGRLPAPDWESASPDGAVRSATEQAVAAVWSEVLGIPAEAVGPAGNFFELGGNSLLALGVVNRLRETFSVPMTFVRFLENPTVAELAALIDTRALSDPRAGTAATRSLALLAGADDGGTADAGTGLPVVFVHPLGGTVHCYRHLVELLRGTGDVYGLTLAALRGAQSEEQETLEEVAGRYAAEIAEALPGPVVLAGWSAGAVTAFELARQLRAAGTEVAQLVMLDPAPPHDNTRWRRHVRELRRIQSRLRLATDDEREAEFRAAMRSDLFRAMGIAPSTCRDYSLFPQEVLRIWQDQLRMLGGHEPGGYAGPMTVLTSQERDGDEQVLLVRQWEDLASGPVKHIPVGGDHLSMMHLPAVASCAAVLKEIVSPREAR